MSKEIVSPFEKELKESYLSYAMSVIVARALPDVRDGLKPVQRRILYTMKEVGNLPGSAFKKSARIVGEVMGKYHPHGDSPIYEALVRMAQDFSLRYPLVEGNGNFGSIDGDPPAAMRYTEVRLAPISMELLQDIEKETIPMRPNFDNSLNEPVVLPAKFPNLLLNGATGIAVGMATNIPPHNISEVVDALLILLRNREASTDEILKVLKGPDFPTRGVIVGVSGIRDYFETGKGRVIIKGRGRFERVGKHLRYIIYELPYLVNKSELIKKIVALVKIGKLKEIDDIRDESSKEGIRVVIDLKRKVDTHVFENKLFKYTQLETSFPVNFVALIAGRPKLFSIREALTTFLSFREEVITRRSIFELNKEKKEIHLLLGIKIAIENLDETVKLIRSSKDKKEAKSKLISLLKVSEEQANAILDMRLSRLVSLEREKLLKEIKDKEKKISLLEKILSNRDILLSVIEKELLDIKKRFGDKRKTEISLEEREEIDIKDMIPDEEVIIFLTKEGYIKRTSMKHFSIQRRGGKGTKGIRLGKGDSLKDIFFTSNHKSALFFTDFGKVYKLNVYEIPEGSRESKGEAVHLLLSLDPDERVTCVLTGDLTKGKYLLMFTKKGRIKRVPLSLIKNIRRNGLKIINLRKEDFVKRTRIVKGDETIVVSTEKGLMARFNINKVRPQGRNASGVIGVRLSKDDAISSFDIERFGKLLFVITSKGKGKRINFSEITLRNRGVKGMRGIKLRGDDRVSAVRSVSETERLVITTEKGKIIKIKVKSVPIQSRNASGVRVIRLDREDRVSGLALEREI